MRALTPRHPHPRDKQSASRRLDHLVVVRESAYDIYLMEGLLGQTIAKVGDIPGAAEIGSIGAERLYKEPDKYGAIEHRQGTSRILTIERDGALYLLSMGSAAKSDDAGENGFVRFLTSLVQAYRPEVLWAVNFTRLVRSPFHAASLIKVLAEHVGTLRCEVDIEPATPMGATQIQLLVMMATTERNYIVQRHTAGRIAQDRRGAWIPNAWPPGYYVKDKVLVLDEEQVPRVRKMLQILADESLNNRECAARIGALGIVTPGIQRRARDGEEAQVTLADARNPSQSILTILNWVDAYEHGIHVTEWENPFPGLNEIAGYPIEYSDRHEHGCLRFEQKVPLPDGGWATHEVFNRVRARRTRTSSSGGAAHRTSPPLAGMFRFDDGTDEYALLAGTDCYRLETRPANVDQRHLGWTGERAHRRLLATVPREVLHRSIASGICRAVAEGAPAELDRTRFQSFGPIPQIDQTASKLRNLQTRLADAQRERDRARRRALDVQDEDEADWYARVAAMANKECKRLVAEIERLEALRSEPTLELAFESTADLVAHAVAALAIAGPSEDSLVRESLRAVVSSERWTVEGDVMSWELFLELPHAHGTVRFGPVRGQVEVRPARPEQAKQRRRLRSELKRVGLSDLAVGLVLACPHSELAEALIAYHDRDVRPVGVDTGWIELVARIYTQPDLRWNRGRWRLDDILRRRVIEVVKRAGGQATRQDFEAAGLNHDQVRYLARRTNAPTGDPIIRRHGATWSLLPCPHCGGVADHSIVTPETVPGVLCSTCWRTPVPESPVFPDWYRTPGHHSGR